MSATSRNAACHLHKLWISISHPPCFGWIHESTTQSSGSSRWAFSLAECIRWCLQRQVPAFGSSAFARRIQERSNGMNKKPNPEQRDQDNPEWTSEMFKQSVRLNALPASLQTKLRGRPKAAVTKERITIRLSPDVVSAFRSTGQGWQTRVDAALREWLKTHSPV